MNATTCNQRKSNGAQCTKAATTPEGTCHQHRKGFYRAYQAVKRGTNLPGA